MAKLNEVDLNVRTALRALAAFVNCKSADGEHTLTPEMYTEIVQSVTLALAERETLYLELFGLLRAYGSVREHEHTIETGDVRKRVLDESRANVLDALQARFDSLCVAYEPDEVVAQHIRYRVDPAAEETADENA
jgi:hypothetical protein